MLLFIISIDISLSLYNFLLRKYTIRINTMNVDSVIIVSKVKLLIKASTRHIKRFTVGGWSMGKAVLFGTALVVGKFLPFGI